MNSGPDDRFACLSRQISPATDGDASPGVRCTLKSRLQLS